MNADAKSARDDLAFLRALVGDDDSVQLKSFGETYFAAGVIYGGQMILHALQALGLIPSTPLVSLLLGLGPTVVFIPVISWILYRNRKNPMRGAVGKAVGGVFAAIGLANFALIAVIGSVAWRNHSIETWLIYPCCIFILQGLAWHFAHTMRRIGWHLAVAVGWYACAMAMALSIKSVPFYILFGGIGLWFCMALPGWAMLRNSRRAAASQ